MGDFGAEARRFVDRLAEAGQSWWQILPLNPPAFGASPYSAYSAFAGNPTLVDPRELLERGWVTPADVDHLRAVGNGHGDRRFDVGPVVEAKDALLEKAFEMWSAAGDDPDFLAFCEAEASWIDDVALFAALKAAHGGVSWQDWPAELVAREPAALARAREEHVRGVALESFRQWVVETQWQALRVYAAERGVRIIGDLPIFVAMDSADVWANRELFEVDAQGHASVVAGVPPDYFSETGQMWGNPLYDWEAMAERSYAWWVARVKRAMATTDLVRIDHFRGFEAYWAIPSDAENAIPGEWVDGPGDAVFDAVREALGEVPFIAEDLGMITDEVRELRDRHELPGMKVLHFAFDGEEDHPFLPHTYPERCVAYTGTHDNDTSAGWYASADDATRHQVRSYLSCGDEGVVWAMMEALSESKADLVVFPVQDLFELGSEARMNTPGTSDGNWTWRMAPSTLEAGGPWARLGRITRESKRG